MCVLYLYLPGPISSNTHGRSRRRLTTLFSISEANRSIDWEQRVGPYFIVAGRRDSVRGGRSFDAFAPHLHLLSAHSSPLSLSLSLISPKSKRTHESPSAAKKAAIRAAN